VSYNQYPAKDEIIVTIHENSTGIGQVVEHEVRITPHDAPPKIDDFLIKVGWTMQMHDPSTMEPLYVKTDEPATQHMSFRWYEAIAYESFKFMTLADGGITDA
jgi:hypothetical protein